MCSPGTLCANVGTPATVIETSASKTATVVRFRRPIAGASKRYVRSSPQTSLELTGFSLAKLACAYAVSDAFLIQLFVSKGLARALLRSSTLPCLIRMLPLTYNNSEPSLKPL